MMVKMMMVTDGDAEGDDGDDAAEDGRCQGKVDYAEDCECDNH